MFDKTSLFVISEDGIYRVEISVKAQKKVASIFNAAVDVIVSKQLVKFTGSYKPEKDETLYIDKFDLEKSIRNALRNPMVVEKFVPNNENLSKIRAIFIGTYLETDGHEKFVVAFQKFRKDQYFSANKLGLFFDGNTFVPQDKTIIAVANVVDCLFKDERLIFDSYFYARQIFDLSQYYRIATDADIDFLIKNDKLDFDGEEGKFKISANGWLRRRIAVINDLDVLNNYTVEQINSLAADVGINLNVKNGKIVIPQDAKNLKVVFGFLDEEAYRGPFSGSVLLANSKRAVL